VTPFFLRLEEMIDSRLAAGSPTHSFGNINTARGVHCLLTGMWKEMERRPTRRSAFGVKCCVWAIEWPNNVHVC